MTATEPRSIPLPWLLAEREKRQAAAAERNKIVTYFADEGATRRELYPKQIEFFNAGARYKERLFMAANRIGKCCTGNVLIETDNGPRTLASLYEGGSPFNVWSWDGSRTVLARASAPFRKGVLPCYRITLADGQSVECADEHRLLTSEGWQYVRDLPSVFPDRRESISEHAPLDHGRGVRGWFEKLAGSLVSYLGGHRQCGAPLPMIPEISRVFSQPPTDALPRSQRALPEDGRENKSASSRPTASCLPSSLDALVRSVARFFGFPIQIACTNAAPSFDSSTNLAQSLPVFLRQQFGSEHSRPVCRTSSGGRPSAYLNASNKIISIDPIGSQDVFDFEVEEFHCYIAGGLIHHNSESGAYELTCHLTGNYPHWWTGRRFEGPIEAWACGTTSETTRDIVQDKLLGPVNRQGTGMIPGDLIHKMVPRRSGIAGSVETVWVKYRNSDRHSVLGLKSYEQGRESFEGTARHIIWCDEEPPEDCYTEMLLRTVTTNGLIYTTFTPLQGMSAVVKGFLEPEKEEAREFKWFIQAGWKDVPHIDENEKRALIAAMPPYQVKARTEGEPSLGAGAIYPIAESEITIPTRHIPDSWVRMYAMDVGWNRTAALWFARDPGTAQLIIYSEYYQGQGEPASHAIGIKSRGDWIQGVIDPAARGRSQIDGRQLLKIYRDLGLKLIEAENAVEAGISDVWQLLVSGQLKVMEHCHNFFSEFRKYHRDDKGNGKIVKTYDHLMDCMRYGVVSGATKMSLKPTVTPPPKVRAPEFGTRAGWMR